MELTYFYKAEMPHSKSEYYKVRASNLRIECPSPYYI